MKILVPVDFTSASLCGFKYAEWLSFKLKGQLTAINIIRSGSQSMQEKKARKPEKDLRERKIKKLTREYPDLCDDSIVILPEVKYHIEFGTIVGNILTYVEKENIDLAVIGTKAKHGIGEYIFGSVSTELIRRIKIPVIIVPEGTPYKTIKKLTYAIDINTYQPNDDDFAHTFSSMINAEISLVNIDKFSEKEEINVTFKENLRSEEPADVVEEKVTIVKNPSVLDGLDHFLHEYKADILALKIPHRNRASAILAGSLSKRMVFNSKLPMLLFH